MGKAHNCITHISVPESIPSENLTVENNIY